MKRLFAYYKTHEMPEYLIWNQMIQRCHNPNTEKYATYGARGIAVCDRWRNSFADFLLDVGVRPYPKATLDRIDNEKGYAPDNCRWTSQRQQQQNRRNNRMISYHGETLCISEWNRRLGYPIGTISQRINRLGWDVVKALTTPIQAQKGRNS